MVNQRKQAWYVCGGSEGYLGDSNQSTPTSPPSQYIHTYTSIIAIMGVKLSMQ